VVSIVCLSIGALALVANGVAHDTSFSSVIRTTRDEGLNRIVSPGDSGELPLVRAVGKQRLRFIDGMPSVQLDGISARMRSGFVLED
jgi:hypothetical protein